MADVPPVVVVASIAWAAMLAIKLMTPIEREREVVWIRFASPPLPERFAAVSLPSPVTRRLVRNVAELRARLDAVGLGEYFQLALKAFALPEYARLVRGRSPYFVIEVESEVEVRIIQRILARRVLEGAPAEQIAEVKRALRIERFECEAPGIPLVLTDEELARVKRRFPWARLD